MDASFDQPGSTRVRQEIPGTCSTCIAQNLYYGFSKEFLEAGKEAPRPKCERRSNAARSSIAANNTSKQQPEPKPVEPISLLDRTLTCKP